MVNAERLSGACGRGHKRNGGGEHIAIGRRVGGLLRSRVGQVRQRVEVRRGDNHEIVAPVRGEAPGNGISVRSIEAAKVLVAHEERLNGNRGVRGRVGRVVSDTADAAILVDEVHADVLAHVGLENLDDRLALLVDITGEAGGLGADNNRHTAKRVVTTAPGACCAGLSGRTLDVRRDDTLGTIRGGHECGPGGLHSGIGDGILSTVGLLDALENNLLNLAQGFFAIRDAQVSKMGANRAPAIKSHSNSNL